MARSKVLVVDDEIDYCMIMKEYFQSRKYDVCLAYTLHDGLRLIDEFHPDFLLLDNNLPDGKGWDQLDKIAAKDPSLKIFLISAYSHRSDVSNPSPNVTVWEKPVSLSMLDKTFKKVG